MTGWKGDTRGDGVEQRERWDGIERDREGKRQMMGEK